MPAIDTITRHTIHLLDAEKFRSADDYAEHRVEVLVDTIELKSTKSTSVYLSGLRIAKDSLRPTKQRTGFDGDVNDLPNAILVDLVKHLLSREALAGS